MKIRFPDKRTFLIRSANVCTLAGAFAAWKLSAYLPMGMQHFYIFCSGALAALGAIMIWNWACTRGAKPIQRLFGRFNAFADTHPRITFAALIVVLLLTLGLSLQHDIRHPQTEQQIQQLLCNGPCQPEHPAIDHHAQH